LRWNTQDEKIKFSILFKFCPIIIAPTFVFRGVSNISGCTADNYIKFEWSGLQEEREKQGHIFSGCLFSPELKTVFLRAAPTEPSSLQYEKVGDFGYMFNWHF
jgi:hypothetical protein